MCLDKVEKTDLNISGSGYKVFRMSFEDKLISPFWVKSKLYDYNKWFKDNNTIPFIGNLKYKPGFHIFLEYPTNTVFSGMNYYIKMVKFKKGHTIGEDYSNKTIVCKEMKIKKFSFLIILNKLLRRK